MTTDSSFEKHLIQRIAVKETLSRGSLQVHQKNWQSPVNNRIQARDLAVSLCLIRFYLHRPSHFHEHSRPSTRRDSDSFPSATVSIVNVPAVVCTNALPAIVPFPLNCKLHSQPHDHIRLFLNATAERLRLRLVHRTQSGHAHLVRVFGMTNNFQLKSIPLFFVPQDKI